METEQQLNEEIALIDILQILWRRKVMIIALTLLLGITAGAVSMMLPKIYKVTAIVEPAKGVDGEPVEQPEAIKENILGGAYDQQLLKTYELPFDEYPKWQVSIPRSTSLLMVSVESDKPELAVRILNDLLTLVSARIEERLQDQKRRLENDIKLSEINHKGLIDRIKLLTVQLRDTGDKIGELENARKNALTSRSSDAMSVLLYSNEIQSQQIYLNNLQLQLENTKQNVESAAIAVDNARLKIAQLKSTNINKEPSVPEKPVKPKKVLIVALALMVGVLGSTVLVSLVEYVQRAGKKS